MQQESQTLCQASRTSPQTSFRPEIPNPQSSEPTYSSHSQSAWQVSHAFQRGGGHIIEADSACTQGRRGLSSRYSGKGQPQSKREFQDYMQG